MLCCHSVPCAVYVSLLFYYLCPPPRSLCVCHWEPERPPVDTGALTATWLSSGFSFSLQFWRKVLHLQNERLLYSPNLFHMAGSYSECRYCLLILSVWKYLVFKMLYCTLRVVMSLLWLFLHKCYKSLLSFFFTNFLKCTLLYIYIHSHNHKDRSASWGQCFLIGDDGGALEVRRSGRGLDKKKWEYLLGAETQPWSCIWIIRQRPKLQTGHGRSWGRKAERSKLTQRLDDFSTLDIIQLDQGGPEGVLLTILLKNITITWGIVKRKKNSQE